MQSRNTCQNYPIIELKDLTRQSEDAEEGENENLKTNIC